MISYGIDPVKREIKDIRRAANCIGAAYAFIFVLDYLLEYFAQHSYDFALFIYNISVDSVYSSLFQITVSFLIFVPPYLLAAHAAGRSAAVAQFGRPKKGVALPLVLMGVGVCQLGEIAANMFTIVMDRLGSRPTMSNPQYGTDIYGVTFAVLSTAVAPALVEEFAMRGIAMGLLRRFGEGFAILLSSVVFGLMHRNLIQAPFAFIVGLGLGFVAVKGGSVFLAVVVHFINNLLSVGFYYLSLYLDNTMQSAVYCSYAALMLAVGVLGFYLCKDKTDVFTLDSGETQNSFLKKTLAFFTSPIMAVSLVLTAVEIF